MNGYSRGRSNSEGSTAPQGGPLSPLLANVLLDEVDKELERGHAFVRYADDCNVYVRSRRAGQRVMQALRHLYGKLRLQVNEEKSAVARQTAERQRSAGSGRPWVQGESGRLQAVAQQVAEELRRYVLGWKAYFGLAYTAETWTDHRRLRVEPVETGKDSVPGVEGSRCEREPRLASCSVRAKLVARGRAPRPAHGLARGVLRRAGCAPAHAVLTSTHRTARCGPACLVVWEGKDRDRRSMSRVGTLARRG